MLLPLLTSYSISFHFWLLVIVRVVVASAEAFVFFAGASDIVKPLFQLVKRTHYYHLLCVRYVSIIVVVGNVPRGCRRLGSPFRPLCE